MCNGRILIAGIGNIFFGDDAFGVAVAHRLAGRPPQEGVHVVDFGIRGLDLTYALLDDYASVILVDAVPRGEPPGTLYVLEPELGAADAPDAPAPMIELHSLDPHKVLRLARAMGGNVERVLLVGCEPHAIDLEADIQMGMSEPVQAAVDEAVGLIESLVNRLRDESRVK